MIATPLMRLFNSIDKCVSLLVLVAVEAIASHSLYSANIDIAVYYMLGAFMSVMISWIAAKYIRTNSSRVYSVIILIQAFICLSLVPDWTYSINEFLQYKLDAYGDIIIQVSIVLGIVSNDRIRNYFSRIAIISSSNDNWNN